MSKDQLFEPSLIDKILSIDPLKCALSAEDRAYLDTLKHALRVTSAVDDRLDENEIIDNAIELLVNADYDLEVEEKLEGNSSRRRQAISEENQPIMTRARSGEQKNQVITDDSTESKLKELVDKIRGDQVTPCTKKKYYKDKANQSGIIGRMGANISAFWHRNSDDVVGNISSGPKSASWLTKLSTEKVPGTNINKGKALVYAGFAGTIICGTAATIATFGIAAPATATAVGVAAGALNAVAVGANIVGSEAVSNHDLDKYIKDREILLTEAYKLKQVEDKSIKTDRAKTACSKILSDSLRFYKNMHENGRKISRIEKGIFGLKCVLGLGGVATSAASFAGGADIGIAAAKTAIAGASIVTNGSTIAYKQNKHLSEVKKGDTERGTKSYKSKVVASKELVDIAKALNVDINNNKINRWAGNKVNISKNNKIEKQESKLVIKETKYPVFDKIEFAPLSINTDYSLNTSQQSQNNSLSSSSRDSFISDDPFNSLLGKEQVRSDELSQISIEEDSYSQIFSSAVKEIKQAKNYNEAKDCWSKMINEHNKQENKILKPYILAEQTILTDGSKEIIWLHPDAKIDQEAWNQMVDKQKWLVDNSQYWIKYNVNKNNNIESITPGSDVKKTIIPPVSKDGNSFELLSIGLEDNQDKLQLLASSDNKQQKSNILKSFTISETQILESKEISR